MNTKSFFKNISFGASLVLLLALIVISSNCVNVAAGPGGVHDSNFPAAVGQPTDSTFQLAKSFPRTGGSSNSQTGGSSSSQPGGVPPGLGMDSLGGPKWKPPTKVEPPPNPTDSGNLPGEPPMSAGEGK